MKLDHQKNKNTTDENLWQSHKSQTNCKNKLIVELEANNYNLAPPK